MARLGTRLGMAALVLLLAGCGAKPERGIEQAFKEYVDAYEARDLDRLLRVWSAPHEERTLARWLLDRADTVAVEIDLGPMTVEDDSATVEFVQSVSYSGPAGDGHDRSALKASLVRRRGGDWMIADISRSDGPERVGLPVVPAPIEVAAAPEKETGSARAAPVAAAPAPEPALSAEEIARRSIDESLRQYRDAFEARDADRLGHVWQMTSIERMLIQRAWDACGDITVEIDSSEPKLEGSAAKVLFDQKLALDCPGQKAETVSRLEASLERQPDGRWVIVRVYPREVALKTAKPLPRREERPAFDRGEVLATLDDYGAALESCDLTELSRVWIMTSLERQILEGVCHRYDKLSVSIGSPRVAARGDGAQVDFVQSISFPGAQGERRTRSELTALLVRRGSGEWAIWKLQESSRDAAALR